MAGALALLVTELGIVTFLTSVAVDSLPETIDSSVVADTFTTSCLTVIADTVATTQRAGTTRTGLIAAGAVETCSALVTRSAEFVATPVSFRG